MDAMPLVEVLKVGELYVGSKPFSQGEAGNLGFPPNCMSLYQGWNLWQDCSSAFPIGFVVDIFCHLICRVYLKSQFLSEGIAPCVVVHLVHP